MQVQDQKEKIIQKKFPSEKRSKGKLRDEIRSNLKGFRKQLAECDTSTTHEAAHSLSGGGGGGGRGRWGRRLAHSLSEGRRCLSIACQQRG